MKKFILIAVMICMCFSLVSISAADEKGTLTISGTTQAKKDNLAIIKLTASSPIEASSISGTLTYDSKCLVVYSVEKSDNLSGWTFNIDTSTSGQINYSGTYKSGGDGPIETDRTLFTVTFIVVSESKSSVSATASAKGTIEEEIETKVINNQDAIDAANQYNLDNELSPADPDYRVVEPTYDIKKEKKKTEKTVSFEKVSQTITVSNPKSNDTYLKSITVDNATLSPSFSKLTSAYKVTIDSEKEVNINYVKEDEKSTVVIQQEVNNQIIMTVTAEDGTAGTYVLTIVRVKNYDSNNPENPSSDPSTETPVENKTGLMGFDQDTLIMLAGGGTVSVIGLLIGTILVIKGKRDMGY